MDIVTLSPRERDRFASWLEQDANANDGLLKQFEKLGHTMMVEVFKRESKAFRLVAQKLRNIEDQTIR